MKNANAANKDRQSGEEGPVSQPDGTHPTDDRCFRSDKCRVLDALEDDEVKEILRANRKSSP